MDNKVFLIFLVLFEYGERLFVIKMVGIRENFLIECCVKECKNFSKIDFVFDSWVGLNVFESFC